MDFQQVIESTRENVRSAQAAYSDKQWKKDRIRKPLLFWLLMDMRFNRQLKDQRILFERGRVVWGAIIQANEALFEGGGLQSCLPAALIYCEDSTYDADPHRLLENAHNMYDLKGRLCTPDMQAFASKLADEMVADIKLPIPTGFTGGAQCYYGTLLVARKHLPSEYLANSFFPILIAPEETKAATILPWSYWDVPFKLKWRHA